VEEIGGEHRRCLGVKELPLGRAGVPLRCRRDLQGLEDPADGRCADLYPQPLFSMTSRSMSAAISALTGGVLSGWVG
jgi:hypothetical protein